MTLLTILGLTDDAFVTILCFVFGGIVSLAAVYRALSLDINSLEVNQERDEKEIAMLRQEIKEVKGELKDSIDEMKDLLHEIKLDIERIRP